MEVLKEENGNWSEEVHGEVARPNYCMLDRSWMLIYPAGI
jgi:hypothetical protein